MRKNLFGFNIIVMIYILSLATGYALFGGSLFVNGTASTVEYYDGVKLPTEPVRLDSVNNTYYIGTELTGIPFSSEEWVDDTYTLNFQKSGDMVPNLKKDLKTGKNPDILTTLGLGSCIGIALWDPVTKIGGLAHVMLPDSTKIRNNSNIAKFADTGIAELVRQIEAMGVPKKRLVAKIAGGARMFEVSGSTSVGNIGEKNAIASKQKLQELGIPILAEDTGLNYGRTVELNCANGDYVIKAVGKPVKTI